MYCELKLSDKANIHILCVNTKYFTDHKLSILKKKTKSNSLWKKKSRFHEIFSLLKIYLIDLISRKRNNKDVNIRLTNIQ